MAGRAKGVELGTCQVIKANSLLGSAEPKSHLEVDATLARQLALRKHDVRHHGLQDALRLEEPRVLAQASKLAGSHAQRFLSHVGCRARPQHMQLAQVAVRTEHILERLAAVIACKQQLTSGVYQLFCQACLLCYFLVSTLWTMDVEQVRSSLFSLAGCS